MNDFYISWISASLFWLGVLIVMLGVSMIVIPKKIHSIAEKLNYWVSTENFFSEADKPRFVERYVYRNHLPIGLLIILGAAYCLYVFFIAKDFNELLSSLPIIASNNILSEWLYQSLFYFIACANVLCLIIGLIIFIRPSLLKRLENYSNHWVNHDNMFKKLDSTRSIPEHVLPGNMRLFGFIVMLGGIYIILTVGKN
jgi:hypothetical protein